MKKIKFLIAAVLSFCLMVCGSLDGGKNERRNKKRNEYDKNSSSKL